MLTITIPPDIASTIAEEARNLGTTVESLAVERLRKSFMPSHSPSEEETLFDFLSEHIGTMHGTTEALSEDCGERFVRGMVEKQKRGTHAPTNRCPDGQNPVW